MNIYFEFVLVFIGLFGAWLAILFTRVR